MTAASKRRQPRLPGNRPHVVFDTLEGAVLALYLWPRLPDGRFPEHLVEVGGRRWAVPLDAFGAADRVQVTLFLGRLSAQCGSPAEVLDTLPAQSRLVRTTEVLDGVWRPSDWETNAGEGTASEQALEGAWRYDPGIPGVRYLLAAADEAQAGHLLKTLSDCLAQGIEARPVHYKGDGEECCYRFFWEVQHGVRPVRLGSEAEASHSPPSLAVTHAAKRAWWGLALPHLPVQVFIEWPYDFFLAPKLFERVNWGLDARAVLLSQSPPFRVVLRVPPDAPTFEPLENFADLHAAERRVTTLSHAPLGDLRFRVDLKLVPQGRRSPTANTIRELQTELDNEIQLRSEQIDRMREQEEDPDDACDAAFEPLFLYLSEATDVPFPLRRILLEWADQHEDVGSLQYMALDPDSLPDGIVPARKNVRVHVVTTSAALGTEGPAGLGNRLAAYRPTWGNHVMYELMPEWARFGLRLFVPYGRQLDLYPDLRPGPLAAEKLSRALLPLDGHGADARRKWCALLLPGEGSALRSFCLPLGDFRSLISAFEWDCRIEVPECAPRVLSDTMTRARETFAETVGKAFEKAVTTEGLKRLGEATEALRDELTSRGSELDQREVRLAEIDGVMDDAARQREEIAREVRTRLDVLEASCEKIADNLEQISQRGTTDAADVESLRAAARDVGELADQVRSLRETYRTLAQPPGREDGS